MKAIRLREGRERALQRRHPWIFDGAIVRGGADSGETVRVESHDGAFLAWGAYSPASQIRVRVWSFDEAERIDAHFFRRRIDAALARRAALAIASDGVRLVHGEADGLPGLIVDRYGDGLLCAQFGATGVERWRDAIADALLAATGATRLYERSDASVRKLEGLEPRTGWLRGDGPTEARIHEHGWRLTLDVAQGHKTGMYLDQRDNRARFAALVGALAAAPARAAGPLPRVLNTFCYTGGFTVAAFAGGAGEVTSVDSSALALARVQAHVVANGFDPAASEVVEADVNGFLRAAATAGRTWDAIVLDPPKLAPTAAQAERAARAYKDLNRLALQRLAPGGLLLTFSCSGGIGPDLFHKIVAGAAVDAGVDGSIEQRLQAAPDHAGTLAFPEGEYLKGLVIRRR
ncbi:MAG: class I SAM-dependent methyltransferase [Rubrivivax sp.]